MNDVSLEAAVLLSDLCAIPALSGQEAGKKNFLNEWLIQRGMMPGTCSNNLWLKSAGFNPSRPTLFLNSHLDTIPPSAGYTRLPYHTEMTTDKLYGLGTNDAGASLVSLLFAFLYFNYKNLPFNLIFTATAEEEISGMGGISLLLSDADFRSDTHYHDQICNWWGIIGEPTGMNMAVAQKGLMVLDAVATGITGHAARSEGVNALYIAMKDIEILRTFSFPEISPLLGRVHCAVTSIHTPNKLHNVIPDECRFVIDVRPNERYTHEEILELLQKQLQSRLTARSMRLQSRGLPDDSPLCMAGKSLGWKLFGSATMSDMALIPFPCVKMGPGLSERSHTADEYILLAELKHGLVGYRQFIRQLADMPLPVLNSLNN